MAYIDHQKREADMHTEQVIRLARFRIGGQMESSARICLADAVSLYDNGEHEKARARAIKSLAYSVGVFHKDYRSASA